MKVYLCEYYLTDGSKYCDTIKARSNSEAIAIANELGITLLGELIAEIPYEGFI